MQKTQKIRRTSKIIGGISMLSLFFGGWNFAQTIDTTILVNGIDAIDIKNTDRQNFNETIKFFCESLGGDGIDYDSSQSLFVYYICKDQDKKPNFNEAKGFSESANTSYTKFKTDADGNEKNILDSTLPGFYNNTEEYIHTLFDKIISSYTSIYQANIYGYTNDPSKTDFTEAFSIKYFNYDTDFINICATDKSYSYPKTCKKLKDYFYAARNLINANTDNILNDENIYKIYGQELIDHNKNNAIEVPYCTETNVGESLIPCGLYGGKTLFFTKLVYNELMFYALFVEYYSYLLENKSDFKNWDITDFQKKLANNENRVQTMLSDIDASRTAMQTTIKMLKEIQYTFPIHIGFLMYSEDIYNITSRMNKVLTPVYTLHDLFRNVQKTE